MPNKKTRKARKFFDDSVAKGEKKVASILKSSGFDGVGYNNTFYVDTTGEFAAGPSSVTTETEAGQAKLMGGSSTDFPTVDLATATTMFNNGNLIGIGVESNIYDAQKLSGQKSDKLVKETVLAYKKIEQLHNETAWGTNATLLAGGLLGFFNHPFIVRASFEPNSNGKIKWQDKTGLEVTEDITNMTRDYYNLNPSIREGGVKTIIHLSNTMLDILTLKKIDNKTTVLTWLEENLPKNRFNVEFVVTNAMSHKDEEFVAIGDFRADVMSYQIPLLTEGLDTVQNDLLIRKNFVSESRGLVVEREAAAIIYEGAA